MIATLTGTLPWPEVEVVGGWWNRRFNPELDLVGADRGPTAQRVHFVGSIKWLGTQFDEHDLAALRRDACYVPGFTPDGTGLVVVSLSGVALNQDRGPRPVVWSPKDVIEAWQAR